MHNPNEEHGGFSLKITKKSQKIFTYIDRHCRQKELGEDSKWGRIMAPTQLRYARTL